MNAPHPAEERLFRNRPFVLYWWARVFTASSYQILSVAVGWQIYALTGKVLDLGLVGLFEFLPRILFLLPAGAAADRFERSRVLLATRCVQGAAVAALALGAAQGWIRPGLIFALAFTLGAARTFEMPTAQAFLPQLVLPAQLPRALAASASSLQTATIVAPALAGFLYALGSSVVYTLSAALYFLAAALTYFLPRIKSVSKLGAGSAPTPRQAELFAGIAYIRRQPDILGAISLDLFAVLLGGATALLPPLARDILKTGPWGLGMLRAAPSVGALAMSLRLARNPPHRKVGPLMFGAVGVFGLMTVALGCSRFFPLSLLVLAVMGGADMISVIIRSSLVQLETPDGMRGRVSAVSSLFIGASNQLGEFESGLTASWFGVAPAVILGGVGTLLVAALWMKRFPSLAQRDALIGESPMRSALR